MTTPLPQDLTHHAGRTSIGSVRNPVVRPSPWSALAVIGALAVPLFFLGMGRLALIDPDEPYYAVPALEMLRAGVWRVPLFHGRPWFDKPVLYYWIVLGSFRLLGVTELAARIGSGLAALAGAAALFFHARGRAPGPAGTLSEILPAIVLATSLEYAVLARFAITDMTLTLFITIGMLWAWRFLEGGSLGWLAGAGAAFGLAALTKGPVGLALPALALLGWSALARRGDLFRPASLLAGGLAAAATAGPWYLYMWAAHRDLLVGTFLGAGNMGRFLTPEHRTSPFFYVAVLALGLIPWSGALPGALFEGARAALAARRDAASNSPLFELCWFGAVILLFSLPASRLATYILPAFPPAALLIGRYWSGRLDRGAGVARLLPAAVGVPVGLLLLFGARMAAGAEWGVAPWILGLLGILIAVGSIAASFLAGARSPRAFIAVQSATSVAVILVVVFAAGPQVEVHRSTRPLVAELRRLGLDADVIGAVQERGFSVDFYLGRTLPRATGRDSLERAVASHPGGIWVVPHASVAQVASNHRLACETVAETPTAAALRLSPAPAPGGSTPPRSDALLPSPTRTGSTGSRTRE